MSKYGRGLALIEEKVGGGKDNVISLATIAMDPSPEGRPRPVSRDIDAFYEDGVFYITTYGTSCKMQQIAKNPEVSFSVNFGWFNGNGIAENLGWVMKPENAELRTKLRTAFEWYDNANNESDENCCILAVRITRAVINHNHGAEFFYMDFVNKCETEYGRVV